ncbi:hypothetical protein CKAH01_03372 [Colletotrichum kahawae]|uniref:Uncharacterized protein n=1 Tax=Colletotrichum kahawae TaxID=34407 RepID=A0AAD9YRN4_COLKA|nr:hypothetical protein CKAH01_03372 [Colletotrichum kahawae]
MGESGVERAYEAYPTQARAPSVPRFERVPILQHVKVDKCDNASVEADKVGKQPLPGSDGRIGTRETQDSGDAKQQLLAVLAESAQDNDATFSADVKQRDTSLDATNAAGAGHPEVEDQGQDLGPPTVGTLR